jgi:hypothetical protein
LGRATGICEPAITSTASATRRCASAWTVSDLSSRHVDAELEVRGQTVSFPLTVSELDARGDELFLKAWGVFDRRGLGMLPPIAGVSRSVDVELNIVAKRADAVP